MQEFIPTSYLSFRHGYNFDTFKKDLIAGITVGIISLPIAMALSIASGVTPDRGLYTSIIAGFLISALGGSRVQVGGPTGAFIVVIYGVIQKTGYEGLAISTLIASAILLLLGFFRLGTWIKFIPHPLIAGFTAGLGLCLFSSQIKDFFGFNMASPPANFIEKWSAYFQAFPTFQPLSLTIGCMTLATILLIRRFVPKIPWGIAAILLSTLICWLLHLPVPTIQSKFGPIPGNLSIPHFPSLVMPEGMVHEIIMNGFSIAFLGAVESLLCCVIADGMTGESHKSNCELVGQGIANFASILFGGLPATGAVARTVINIKAGAQTPMAGMIHAATLLMILLFFSSYVSQIPLASLAAVLIMIAWNMSEVGCFIRLFKSPIGDIAILATSFFLTVFVDITVAITIGMVLASFVFMKRMSSFSRTVPLTQIFREHGSEFPERIDPDAISNKSVPDGVEVYELQGPFFFGAADLLKDMMNRFHIPPKIFILRMRHVPIVDASGMRALDEFYYNCRKKNTVLLLSGIHAKTKEDLEEFGFIDLIGKEHVFSHIDHALERAEVLLK
ncbi:MAG TPA: sulfate permease [Chlamydiales bacterium]|nr:sulfate permease [Chlamydiales bacterium]